MSLVIDSAARTARFWWINLAFFCALFAWYAVQVHQTKYLVEIGFGSTAAAWAKARRWPRACSCNPSVATGW